MEENKSKKAPNLVLAVICVVLILVFGVGAAICIVNLKQGKYNNAEPSKEKNVVNVEVKDVEDIDEEDAKLEETKEEVDEDFESNETEILEENDELAEVKDVIDKFVKAVNEKDWDEVEKLSSKVIVDELKEYEFSNFSVDTSKLDKNPNIDNGYVAISHYDISYEGMTPKDLSLGNFFCVDKVNGEFVVTAISATGL